MLNLHSFLQNFRKGTLSNFLMTTFGDLGQLEKVEFWLEYDNAARQHDPAG